MGRYNIHFRNGDLSCRSEQVECYHLEGRRRNEDELISLLPLQSLAYDCLIRIGQLEY